jgi:hypothetical protein
MDELSITYRIIALCSDIVCKLDKPVIEMSKWEGKRFVTVGSSVVYEFVRKP